MPFPFLPVGAILAASVLVGALTVFGLILRAMDRAVTGVRDMAVSSIVAGLRGWSESRPIHVPFASPHVPPNDPLRTMPAGPGDGFGRPEIVDLGTRRMEEPARRR